MQRSALKQFDLYYARVKHKQVPVQFACFSPTRDIPTRLVFTRLDTGETLYKRRADALSRHSDRCVFRSADDPDCQCADELYKVLLLPLLTSSPNRIGLSLK